MAHSPTEAGALRDALATAAYCRLFEWVLREGCEAMEGLARATEAADAARRRRTSSAFPAAAEGATSAVGVLDLFGFESFTTNSLEQLLINFANEKLQASRRRHHHHRHLHHHLTTTSLPLQAQYVSLVLTLEQREYLDQQLTVEAVEVPQTDHALRLLEDPMGVLSLLDEQLRLGDRGSDANLTLALQRAHASHAAMAECGRRTAPTTASLRCATTPERCGTPPAAFCGRAATSCSQSSLRCSRRRPTTSCARSPRRRRRRRRRRPRRRRWARRRRGGRRPPRRRRRCRRGGGGCAAVVARVGVQGRADGAGASDGGDALPLRAVRQPAAAGGAAAAGGPRAERRVCDGGGGAGGDGRRRRRRTGAGIRRRSRRRAAPEPGDASGGRAGAARLPAPVAAPSVCRHLRRSGGGARRRRRRRAGGTRGGNPRGVQHHGRPERNRPDQSLPARARAAVTRSRAGAPPAVRRRHPPPRAPRSRGGARGRPHLSAARAGGSGGSRRR